MTPSDYLDALRVRLNTSDQGLARALKTAPAQVSNYRAGRRAFDDTTCLKIARLLAIRPARVLCDMQAFRAHDAKAAAVWRDLAKAL